MTHMSIDRNLKPFADYESVGNSATEGSFDFDSKYKESFLEDSIDLKIVS